MKARASSVALAAVAVGLAACSGPARPSDLVAAEQAEHGGDFEAALAEYDQAQARCTPASAPGAPAARPSRRRREACAGAHLQRAELLERMGRVEEAADAYERTAEVLAGDLETAATATYRAGRLRLDLGQDERAYTLLWRTVTHYPDQAHASDALRLVVLDGRRRNAAQLYEELGKLVTPLAHTGVADSLLRAMADLAEHELGQPRVALSMLDKIIKDYPQSGLRDDAWWHGARLARALGDAAGAVQRLRALLATRQVSFMVGSYFSVWLDDAQLALGRILRDDLGDVRGAVAAFARLPEDYPDSVLIDDARWEIAKSWAAAGDDARACAALDRLGRAHPDSRYEIADAPALRRTHGCATPSR
ncbi:MAG TPA: tetratricopeptide repeat protein [Haliangium sp.]|nr:tetratricopeptide repeat protein [Haliangium sp.]